MGYENNDYLMNLSAQVIFGGVSAKGKLPVTASEKFPVGVGLATPPPIRFKYTAPEDAGIDPKKLEAIDTIVANGIAQKAFPGCEIFLVKDRQVFYYTSLGYHTYENKRPVKKHALYDLARMTTIAD